jgi:hypothetical protein
LISSDATCHRHRETPGSSPEITMKIRLDDFFESVLMGSVGVGSLAFIAALVIVML